MSRKLTAFAEGMEENARGPTADTGVERSAGLYKAVRPYGDSGEATELRQRRRRRPCKVMMYYLDSDAEDTEESGGGMPSDLIEAERLCVTPAAQFCSSCGGPIAAGAAPPSKPISPENPRIGSPTPIGFFAFGMTTLLYNVHNAQICKLNMATMGLVIAFGGLTQFICGFLELINMNTLGCTISTTYGAFWLATAVLFLEPENAFVTMGDHSYSGGFFLLWTVFAVTLFAGSFRSPFTCMALFFLVPLNFLLQSIGFFMASDRMAQVAGYEGILVGALATYLGMAFTLRDVYGRSLLPILFQKNLRYIEW